MIDKQHVKYPKLRRVATTEMEGIFDYDNDIIYIQEKVDGGNFQFQITDDGQIIFGSRRIKLDEGTSSFIAIPYILDKFNNCENCEWYPGYIYYGESMQKHTLEYKNTPPFIGFDILDKKTGKFLCPDDAKIMFQMAGLPFIKEVARMTAKDAREIDSFLDFVGRSSYGYIEMEGVTIKNYDRLNKYGRPYFAKCTTEKFQEKNREVFGDNGNTPKKTQLSKIVEMYCTPTRIDKQIHAIKNEGREIDMSIMPELYKRVGDDIVSEEILEIAKDLHVLDFKKFYKYVAGKCARHLKDVLGG